MIEPSRAGGMRRSGAALAVLALLLAAVAGARPATAEIVVVTDATPFPVSLPAPEQARVEALLGARTVQVLSTVGPDNRSVVVHVTPSVRSTDDDPAARTLLLDLESGATTDVPAAALPANPAALRTRPMTWAGPDLLRYVETHAGSPTLVTVNLRSAIVSRTTVGVEGEVVSVAPDGSRVIVAIPLAEPPVGPGDTGLLVERVLAVVDLATLAQIEIDRVPPFFSVGSVSWSADGRIAAIVPSAYEVTTLGRSPYSPTLGSPIVQDALGRLSPDRNPLLQRNGLRVYDFAQPEPLITALRAREGDGDIFNAVAVSPDGRQLVALMHRPGRVQGRPFPVYAFPESGYARILALDGTVLDTIDRRELAGAASTAARWAGNDRVLFGAAVATDFTVHAYDLAGRRFRRLPLPAGTADFATVQATADGATAVLAFSSVTQPQELYRLALDGDAAPVALTAVNAEAAAANRVRVDELRFRLASGAERQGFLVQPADAPFPPRRIPLVFWQQGGPGGVMVNEFSATVEQPFNLLPNFGIAVLVVPLSGREGFGGAFYRALADDDHFGRIDIDEAAEVLAQLDAAGITAPGLTGISGCSYGGYFTSQLIARHPHLVAAANPQCSLHDTITEWQTGYTSFMSYLMGRTPLESFEAHRAASPLYLAGAVRVPALIFHGADDFLQIDITRTYHDVLAANGVEVTLYEFRGEPHGLRTYRNELLAAQLQIAFFRAHLRDGGAY